MKYLAVDDEELQLKRLTDILKRLRPQDEVLGYFWPEDALEAAAKEEIDVAFLDIQMGGMTGLELAVKIKQLRPKCHIVFVTGFQEYALDAYAVHATGYLLKPVSEQAIQRELTFLYGEEVPAKRIRVQTFGGFEVFVDGNPVKFDRQKAKELLAYLVDHRGASVTSADAYAALFEDREYNLSQRTYFRNIVKSLKNSLQNAGIEEMLLRQKNTLGVLTDTFECDYYRFLSGDPIAVNAYQNDYLPAYAWAEMRNGELSFSGKD